MGNIFKFGVVWTAEEAEKMCVFQRKTNHVLETVRDMAKVINYY